MESAWDMAGDPCADAGLYQGYMPAAAAHADAADGFVSIIFIQEDYQFVYITNFLPWNMITPFYLFVSIFTR